VNSQMICSACTEGAHSSGVQAGTAFHQQHPAALREGGARGHANDLLCTSTQHMRSSGSKQVGKELNIAPLCSNSGQELL